MKTKVRQTAKAQEKNSALRETANNNALLSETIEKPVNQLDETNRTKQDENETKTETETARFRKICANYFDNEKNNVLFNLAVSAIEKSIVDYYGNLYGENFAKTLLKSAKDYTKNFSRIFVDKIDGELKKSDEKITIGNKSFFSIVTDRPTTSSAICVVFNSFLTFAISAKLPCVAEIIKDRETEKTTEKVSKLTEKIGVDNLAAILANNPELMQALLQAQQAQQAQTK